MRLTARPENPTEAVALALNLAPVPVAQAMFGMPISRVVIAGQRLGIFGRLAKGPATSSEIAADLGLHQGGADELLRSIAVFRFIKRSGDRYVLSQRARRWLDPASDFYVGSFIEHCADYWDWWARLDDAVRTGEAVAIHTPGPDDPHWRRYMRGQFELARLSGREVGRAIPLRPDATALLDVAGGHGWFSVEVCRRYAQLQATVLDLPGSAAIGREIVARAGMADRVRFVEGDLLSADLGGPYDGALCFNIIHHLSPEQNAGLFRRLREALRPRATVAVLDLFRAPNDQRLDTSTLLGLFFFLTSGTSTYTPDDLQSWLGDAGFSEPKRRRIKRIPGQTLYTART
ncbi:MAG: methyltransferase domain-containing protein [Actinomycetota bacterium]|nr:methyltransferase domain-containing protein [Actinomycetota bacterium]